jgi:hypothetical protein
MVALLRVAAVHVACVQLMWISPAFAYDPDAGKPEVWVAASVKDFGYKEYSDAGELFDREDGVLPGFVLGIGVQPQALVVGGEFRYHAGTVTYSGQTNLGVPVESRTDTVLADGELRVGHRLEIVAIRLTPYMTLGYHYWDRDIRTTQTASGRSVSGLHETYRWYSVGLGARAAIAITPDTRAALDVRAFRVKQPTMVFHATSSNDEATLALGEKNGWRLALPIDYSLSPTTTIGVEFYAEGWQFGRSASQNLTSGGVVVGSVYEPRSETRVNGALFGLRHRFK